MSILGSARATWKKISIEEPEPSLLDTKPWGRRVKFLYEHQQLRKKKLEYPYDEFTRSNCTGTVAWVLKFDKQLRREWLEKFPQNCLYDKTQEIEGVSLNDDGLPIFIGEEPFIDYLEAHCVEDEEGDIIDLSGYGDVGFVWHYGLCLGNGIIFEKAGINCTKQEGFWEFSYIDYFETKRLPRYTITDLVITPKITHL